MEDTLLVSRAMAGDLDSFGQLYDRYFPRVYDFTWRTLKDADEAASVTESIFATAMTSLAALPNAASFRSWLFAIAYRATVTRAAGLGTGGRAGAVHEEAFGSFDVPDACFVEDPSVAGGDPEIAALVWEAATALSPRDYAVLDLHVRQGLDSAEIAAVLTMNKSNAYTLVNRMKSAASDVMTGYIVARTGNKTCDALQRVLAPFDFPPYTDEVRQAVDAHVRDCEVCQATRKAVPAPLTVLGAFAAVRPPMSLKGDVWRAIAASWHVPRAQASMITAGDATSVGGGSWIPGVLPSGGGIGLTGDGGFGGGTGAMGSPGWDRKRILLFAGAAGGMLLFAFLIGTVLVMAVGGGGGGGGGPVVVTTETSTVTPTATVAASETPGVAVVTPTAETATPAPATPTPTPAPPTPTSTSAPPAATSTPAGIRSATPTPLKTPVGGTATPTAKKTTAGTATPTP